MSLARVKGVRARPAPPSPSESPGTVEPVKTGLARPPTPPPDGASKDDWYYVRVPGGEGEWIHHPWPTGDGWGVRRNTRFGPGTLIWVPGGLFVDCVFDRCTLWYTGRHTGLMRPARRWALLGCSLYNVGMPELVDVEIINCYLRDTHLRLPDPSADPFYSQKVKMKNNLFMGGP